MKTLAIKPFRALASIGLGAILVLSFQNCAQTDKEILLPGPVGDGSQASHVIPAGNYARRWFYDPCGDALAEVQSDGVTASLNMDDCEPADFAIEDYMVDHSSFNDYVFGLGPAIMRRLEPGQTPADAPFDVMLCRYEDDLVAHDIMLYHEGDHSDLALLSLKVLVAQRASTDADWVLVSDQNHPVLGLVPNGTATVVVYRDPDTSLSVEMSAAADQVITRPGVYNSEEIVDAAVDCWVEGDRAIIPVLEALPRIPGPRLPPDRDARQ